MEFEWDPEKTTANAKKHGVETSNGFSVLGCRPRAGFWLWRTPSAWVGRASSALVKRVLKNENTMHREVRPEDSDEMRPEYDFSQGVRGKHYQAYRAGTNVVLLEPDIAAVFPDSASVNEALRLLVRLAKTKGVVEGRANKAPQPTSRAKRKAKSRKSSRAARG